jgi:uncharacterized protein (TIGR02996 family)
MDEEAGFIAALAADPSDRTAALVFADWLDDRGDPRGAMLRIDEVRAWMAPKYENPLPGLLAAVESGKGVTKASQVLARIGEAAVPGLVALLKHETPRARLRAVKALRLLGPKAKAAIPALTELVKGKSRGDTAAARREAVAVLGVLRAKRSAQDELAKGLDSADDAERLAAVEAMAKLRTRTAASSLCKVLADESAEVRRAAAHQLQWIASPSMTYAVEPLRKALADEQLGVRSSAVMALGRIGPKAAAAVPDLIRLLNGADTTLRRIVIDALGQVGVGTPEVLEALLAALRDTETQPLAINALARWPAIPTSAAPALLEFIRKPNSGTAYWDAQLTQSGLKVLSLITPPPPEVLEALRAQLIGSGAHAAVEALGKLGPPAAALLPALVAAFHEPGPHCDAYTLAKAIGRIGGDGIAALTEALDREPSENDPTPIAAAYGLKEAGPAARSALPALRALLARFHRQNVSYGQAIVVDATVSVGPEAAVAAPEFVAKFLEPDCPLHYADALGDALRVFGPAVLPFAPQLTEALGQSAHARKHHRIAELLTGLVRHGFDGFTTFRDALRRVIAGDFYADSSYSSEYHRRVCAGAAVAGLAALGPAAEEAIPDLVLADQTFNNWELRVKVLAAYGAIGGPAVAHIRAALIDPARDVRLAAIKAFGASGDESVESQEALRKLETDAVKLVRAQAIAALRKMTTPKRKRS